MCFWALPGLAPTNLTLSGACGGLLAGSMATIAYLLGCPEMQIPFWRVWYLLGMLVPTLLGALLGRSWLRWYVCASHGRTRCRFFSD
ncbi:NrsF family protein [Pseudomonas migulae]